LRCVDPAWKLDVTVTVLHFNPRCFNFVLRSWPGHLPHFGFSKLVGQAQITPLAEVREATVPAKVSYRKANLDNQSRF
jgi:hypothetical protein